MTSRIGTFVIYQTQTVPRARDCFHRNSELTSDSLQSLVTWVGCNCTVNMGVGVLGSRL
jgi:hypothetical protein